MSSEQEKEKKWSMPFNIGYESFQLILKTLFQQKADEEPVSLSRIGSIAGLNPKTISSNMTFLKAINVIVDETKNGYQLTPWGVEYAKAIYTNDKNATKEKSLELIQNSHLKSLADKIDLKKDSITLEEIYLFIKGQGRYAEGAGTTGMTPPYATGAKALINIFDEAGILPESLLEVSSESSSLKQTPKKSAHRPKQRHKTKEKADIISTNLASDTFGRVVASGVGTVDITDNETYTLAQSFMNLIKKKIEEKNTRNSD